jgi:hypothetical protein
LEKYGFDDFLTKEVFDTLALQKINKFLNQKMYMVPFPIAIGTEG